MEEVYVVCCQIGVLIKRYEPLCVSNLGDLRNHLELIVISLGNPGDPGILWPQNFVHANNAHHKPGTQGTPGLLAPQKLVDLRKKPLS